MSFFRNITWYFRGLKEYTKSGFEAASQHFNVIDLEVDLSGRSFMITGANSGVGKACAEQLARRGATIHMVCRSRERGEEALRELKNLCNSEKFSLHLLDMSNPGDVYKFAKTFSNSGEKLDVLINNAGCMVNKLDRNAEGIELNFATNTLSTYILTEGLIALLKKSDDPRVVVVSSGGMLVQKLDVSDVNWDRCGPAPKFDGTMVYAQNKRQQVVMVEHWATKYSSSPLFFSMHPGWADTPAVASSMPSFYAKHQTKLRTAEQGADTIVWLAAAPSAKQQPSGEFFQDRKVTTKHLPLAWTRSSKTEEENLMAILEKYLKQYSESA